MKTIRSVEAIRDNLKDKKGAEIKFIVQKGKRRRKVQKGIISNVYPSIFTIMSDGANLSFSYIDILTKTVELAFISEQA